MSKNDKILMGMISGVHGIKGLLKLKSYTARPEDIFTYKELYDEDLSRVFCFTLKGVGKDCFLVALKGCENRNQAEELKGVRLYVKKDALPILEEDTFWHNDLIGLDVKDADGHFYGKVNAVYNFGAGDIIDVKTPESKSVMLPFTKQQIPVVNVMENYLVISDKTWFSPEKEKENV